MEKKVTGEQATVGRANYFEFMLRKVHPVDISQGLNVTTEESPDGVNTFTLPSFKDLNISNPKASIGLKVIISLLS